MGERRAGGGRIGTVFAGRFRIEGLLGRGGFGAVYLARHTVLNRRFALKLLRHGFTADAETIGRFRREARAASLIDSPHVAYVFDFGHAEDGTLYIAMEYVEGTNLARVLARQPYLPLERSLDILGQVAIGLSAAHRRNVIHRDIKPENIALAAREPSERGDFVKILDFGLAKVLGSEHADAKLSRSDVILGTAEYIAPEYFGGAPSDQRSDLYAVGVLAFELLVGRAPFEGKPLEVLMAHLNNAPAVPSRVAPQAIPDEVDAIVLRLLAKEPASRYAHADELQHAILRAQRKLGLRPTAAPAGTWTRRGAPEVADPADAETGRGFAEAGEGSDEWPGERDAGRDGKRARAIQTLAFELCDSGAADDELRRALIHKLMCEADLLAADSDIALLESEAVEHGRSLTQQSAQLRRALVQLQALADPAALAEEVTQRLARVSEALKRRVTQLTDVVDERREGRRATMQRIDALESDIIARAQALRAAGRLDDKLARTLDELDRDAAAP